MSWTSIRIVCCAVAAVALISVMTSVPAHAVVVPLGDTLQITFDLAGPASIPDPPGPPFTLGDGLDIDTLGFHETTGGQSANATAQLFNGSTLLGTVTFIADSFNVAAFSATDSAYTFGSVGRVPDADWSAFVDGTINGVLDVTFDQTIDITVTIGTLGIGDGSSIVIADQQPQVTGEEVLSSTPLPATLPLFAGGLGFVGYLTGRKKRKASAALAT